MRSSGLLGLAIGFLLGPALAAAEDPTATLVLEMSGFTSSNGHVRVHLANSRENLESDGKGFRVAKLTVEDGAASTRFTDLPYGEYAIKVFHDENDNEELDIGWRGPEERYGFSNDARGMMGPADWEEAKFSIDSPKHATKITLE